VEKKKKGLSGSSGQATPKARGGPAVYPKVDGGTMIDASELSQQMAAEREALLAPAGGSAGGEMASSGSTDSGAIEGGFFAVEAAEGPSRGESVSATDFKAKCLEILDQVNRTGKPVSITKRGIVVAELRAPYGVKPTPKGPGFARGRLRITGDIVGPTYDPGQPGAEEWDAMAGKLLSTEAVGPAGKDVKPAKSAAPRRSAKARDYRGRKP
jgi:antitoxin (DNA-binding transcriptional repressor) of toxin-antitoxin stability system